MQVHFVDAIPHAESIEEDHLYISIPYRMTVHRCASGCGQLVPLPLSPTDWSLTYDGETVSFNPSVGNGVLACNSHYRINKSQIMWLPGMSSAQTKLQQKRDMALINQYSAAVQRKQHKSSLLKAIAHKLRINTN